MLIHVTQDYPSAFLTSAHSGFGRLRRHADRPQKRAPEPRRDLPFGPRGGHLEAQASNATLSRLSCLLQSDGCDFKRGADPFGIETPGGFNRYFRGIAGVESGGSSHGY
jgi:hypothetical protein